MRSLLIPVLATVSLTASAAAAQTSAAQEPCFDLAVIATSPSYHWRPAARPADPNEIVMREPVELAFDVEDTLAGASEPDTVIVDTTLHTQFNPKIGFFLLFLKHLPSGHFRLMRLFYQLVQDYDGAFVWPLAGPVDSSYLDEDRFFPSNYETLLRPIYYRPDDAWWLTPPLSRRQWDKPIVASDYPWGEIRKGEVVVATRGLRIRDLVNAASDRRCRGS